MNTNIKIEQGEENSPKQLEDEVVLIETGSSLQDEGNPENEAALIKSGSDKETNNSKVNNVKSGSDVETNNSSDVVIVESGSDTETNNSSKVVIVKSGNDKETSDSSKVVIVKSGDTNNSSKVVNVIEKNRIRLSGAARKRMKYLIKQGLPVEEARLGSVEPMKKEPTSMPIEPTNSSKALDLIGKNKIRLSGAARKRMKYLVKQGLPIEEARLESVEPMKKQSTSDKGLWVRSEEERRGAERGSSDSMPIKNIRLSGAARKRLKYFIKQGVPVEEARLKSVEPMKESTSDKGLQRVWSEEERNPDVHLIKRARGPERGSSASMPIKPTFSHITRGVKVCILPKYYPKVLLTTEQMESVRETILDKIIEIGKNAAVQPHFHSSHNGPGWVSLMCADDTTMHWLKGVIKGIKPWRGAELRVVEEAELPHDEILVAYLPGSQGYSTEKILGLMEAQNKSLNAINWRVLNRTSEGPLELLTLSVDLPSAERLRKTEFVINYQFGHATLRPRGGEPKAAHPNLAPQEKAQGSSDKPSKLKSTTICLEEVY
ncbi:hypothetical protein JTB14_004425 [Gonioctena quinquepunctata]|nr:hypothetical protein JTB14_004425 [Gonioctena quinquepunctata]